jgi:hypothetical protein
MIKNYFKLLYLSFTQPSSYKKWLVLPKKHILQFFIISLLIVGFFQGVILSIRHIPQMASSFIDIQEKLINQYPDDLVISWQDQNFSLSPSEKYQTIDLNLKDIEAFNIDQDIYLYYRENQITEEDKQQLLESNTLFLINDQNIQFKTEENEIHSTPIKNILETGNFTLTKQDLPFIQDEVKKQIVEWQPKIQLAIPFISAPLNLGAGFFASLIFTVFLWFFLQLIPLNIKKWRHAWRLTLAVMVTVSYLELATQLIYPQNTTSIRELAFWLITGYVLLTWKFPKFKIAKKN